MLSWETRTNDEDEDERKKHLPECIWEIYDKAMWTTEEAENLERNVNWIDDAVHGRMCNVIWYCDAHLYHSSTD
jgi:hypothetical protein